ncbi:hypothetical protein DSO57_1020883 [Entomophthora muscae]|uniref:Uncharacterized protein n=1 Tax=Entomophthora muscae TaxID=34485 RepID=A0ACC2RUL1_9FUNG|nr:hypothetical protein DSO57_1020883 [Entomophthora muscae]
MFICFLVLPVFSGFISNPFITKTIFTATSFKDCPGLTKITSYGEIDTECPITLDNLTCPISFDLTKERVGELKPPVFNRKDNIHTALNIVRVWSGAKAISKCEFCYENEECHFYIQWTKAGGWAVEFLKQWRITTDTLDPRKSIRIKHIGSKAMHTSFKGPLKATALVNQIALNVSWIETSAHKPFCIFCQPKHRMRSFPAFYKDLPIGMLGIQRFPLPYMFPVLNEGFVSSSL